MNTLTLAVINCIESVSKHGPENIKLIIEAYQKKYVEMTNTRVPELELKPETDPKKLRYYSIIYGIKKIAEERLKQLKKGHTLETDRVWNDMDDLIDGALFCLTLDTFYYPKKWQASTMEKILSMDLEERVTIAGGFIAGCLDVGEYIRGLQRVNQDGLINQLREVNTYEPITISQFDEIFEHVRVTSEQLASMVGVPSNRIGYIANATSTTSQTSNVRIPEDYELSRYEEDRVELERGQFELRAAYRNTGINGENEFDWQINMDEEWSDPDETVQEAISNISYPQPSYPQPDNESGPPDPAIDDDLPY